MSYSPEMQQMRAHGELSNLLVFMAATTTTTTTTPTTTITPAVKET